MVGCHPKKFVGVCEAHFRSAFAQLSPTDAREFGSGVPPPQHDALILGSRSLFHAEIVTRARNPYSSGTVRFAILADRAGIVRLRQPAGEIAERLDSVRQRLLEASQEEIRHETDESYHTEHQE